MIIKIQIALVIFFIYGYGLHTPHVHTDGFVPLVTNSPWGIRGNLEGV